MPLDLPTAAWFLVAIALVAALYASVGQGGGSGYLAVMGVLGVEALVMKPAALSINVFVAALVLFRLVRAGHFRWPLFWPFAVTSIPASFLGGAWRLDEPVYYQAVGAVLIVSAILFVWHAREPARLRPSRLPLALVLGALLGFVGGLTGIGGGIFLSPVLLLLGWCRMRETAGAAAAFILVNSLAALAGFASSASSWPQGLPLLIAAALAGSLLGSEIGLRWAPVSALIRILGVVLAIAGMRMLLSL